MSCHVSNHYDAVEDPRKLDFEYRLAAGGALGYELNALAISQQAKDTKSRQIEEYRTYEHLILREDVLFCHAIKRAKGEN